jgi:hypothetical protein
MRCVPRRGRPPTVVPAALVFSILRSTLPQRKAASRAAPGAPDPIKSLAVMKSTLEGYPVENIPLGLWDQGSTLTEGVVAGVAAWRRKRGIGTTGLL